MNCRDIEYILSAAETGSFAAAAALCHVSQPSLSIQIKKVEDQLGHIIFMRGQKGVQLTSFGEELVKYLQTIQHNLQSINTLAKNYQGQKQPPIRLGAIATTAPYLFPYLLDSRDFILTESTTKALIKDLLNEAIDAAILALPVRIYGLDILHLYDEPFLLAMSKAGHCADNINLENLRIGDECRFLLLSEEHCMANQTFDICKLDTHKKDRVFKYTSLETIRKMLVKSDGDVTLMPALARRENDGLSYYTLGSQYFRSIGLVFRSDFSSRDSIDKLAIQLKTLAAQELESLDLST